MTVSPVLASGPAHAGSASDPAPVQIVDVDLAQHPSIEVTLDVSGEVDLTDATSALSITEDGAPLPIGDVKPAGATAVQVILVMDGSGSMQGFAVEAARAAAHGFVEQLPDNVTLGLVSFGDVPVTLLSPTTDRAAAHAAIDMLTASGETALYDALIHSVAQFAPDAQVRHIVLLSDGGDTVSLATADDVRAWSAGTDIQVVALATSDSDQVALEALASDGEVHAVGDPALLPSLYEDLARSFSQRFVVEATSAATGPTVLAVSVDLPSGRTRTARQQVEMPEPAPEPAAVAPAAPEEDAPTTVPVTLAPAAAPVDLDEVVPADGGSRRFVGAGLVVAAVLVLVVSLRSGPSRKELVRRRLVGGSAAEINTPPRRSLADLIEDSLARRGRLDKLDATLRRAGVETPAGQLVGVLVVVSLLLFVLGTLLVHPAVGVLLAVAAPLVARGVINHKVKARRAKFINQLPDVLQLLQGMLTSGFGLQQALRNVAEQVAEPARSVFAQAILATRSGRDVSDALREAAAEMESPDFDWVVTAIDINTEIGGDLASTLASVAEAIRERQRLRGQVKSLTAEGRLSAYIMLALPPGVLLFSAMSNPEYVARLFHGVGLVLLVVAMLLMGLGFFWMRKMIDKVMA